MSLTIVRWCYFILTEGEVGDDIWMTSSRKPGRKRSIRSCVAVHKARCCSSLESSFSGGSKSPAAFMTKSTFLSDSGTASYYRLVSRLHVGIGVGRTS